MYSIKYDTCVSVACQLMNSFMTLCSRKRTYSIHRVCYREKEEETKRVPGTKAQAGAKSLVSVGYTRVLGPSLVIKCEGRLSEHAIISTSIT